MSSAIPALSTMWNFLALNVMPKQKPEWVVFIEGWLNSPREAGTPFSCSTAVAERMVRHIPAPDDSTPRIYLEVGPGTGVVTELFVRELGQNDKLHIVEIEKAFYELIKKKYEGDKRVVVHLADISTWKLEDGGHEVKFDAIATGVPLNNLPSEQVLKSILVAYERLAKPGAEITSVEYVGTSTVGKWTKGKEFNKVVDLKCKFYAHHAKEAAAIEWRNFPVPARVHRLQINTPFFKGE